MKWVEGIPTIFGKGNWYNRLKRFINQGGKDLHKSEYCLFSQHFA